MVMLLTEIILFSKSYVFTICLEKEAESMKIYCINIHLTGNPFTFSRIHITHPKFNNSNYMVYWFIMMLNTIIFIHYFVIFFLWLDIHLDVYTLIIRINDLMLLPQYEQFHWCFMPLYGIILDKGKY